MISFHTAASKKADSEEEAGRYTAASDLYVASAAERIATNFPEATTDPSTRNLAVADLLHAAFCARCAEDSARANGIGTVRLGLIGFLRIAADAETRERVWSNILDELAGDCCLVTEVSDPVPDYEQAASAYARLDESEAISEGLEPEFVRAHWAVEDYLAWRGIDLADHADTNGNLCTNFEARIRAKQRLIDDCSPTE